MRYLTDRKRAEGLGSAKSGTGHHWYMQVSAVGLAVLVPLFLFTFGRVVGADHATVVDYFGRPFPAIVTGLTLWVGMLHFRHGAQMMIEDYAGGFTRKVLVVATVCLTYGTIATGLYALIRLAL